MEMLIVVAIIAILVAIAIPVFSSQLNNAHVAADAANIRGGYAAVSAKVLTDKVSTEKTYQLNADGTVSETATTAYTTTGDNSTDGTTIAGQDVKWASGKTVSYTYNPTTNIITINVAQ